MQDVQNTTFFIAEIYKWANKSSKPFSYSSGHDTLAGTWYSQIDLLLIKLKKYTRDKDIEINVQFIIRES